MKLTTYLRAICKIPAVRVFARRLLKVGSYVVKCEQLVGGRPELILGGAAGKHLVVVSTQIHFSTLHLI